jgi:integrase
LENILDAAKAAGLRSGENPARWRGHLQLLLPRQIKLTPTHHAAMPFAELPAFFEELTTQPGAAARALRLTILTACRTSEVLAACWSEFDLANKIWVIPAERMKAGRPHRVPLSQAALDIIAELKTDQADWWKEPTDFLFPSPMTLPKAQAKPMSNMAMAAVLKRMKRGDVTVHGFRSTFRDWAAERTNFPAEVAEMALAHAVGSEVERAYRRGDLFEKRRKLMEAWADFAINSGSGKIVRLHNG